MTMMMAPSKAVLAGRVDIGEQSNGELSDGAHIGDVASAAIEHESPAAVVESPAVINEAPAAIGETPAAIGEARADDRRGDSVDGAVS